MWERGIRLVWCDFVGKARDIHLVRAFYLPEALCSSSQGFLCQTKTRGALRDHQGGIGDAEQGV